MVEVTVYRYADGRLRGFRITGHARERTDDSPVSERIPFGGPARHLQLKASGVCGGVSALVLHTVAALRYRAGIDLEYRINHGGTFCCLPDTVPEDKQAAAALLLEALLDSFVRMSEEYGEFVKITDGEVMGKTSHDQEEVRSHGT